MSVELHPAGRSGSVVPLGPGEVDADAVQRWVDPDGAPAAPASSTAVSIHLEPGVPIKVAAKGATTGARHGAVNGAGTGGPEGEVMLPSGEHVSAPVLVLHPETVRLAAYVAFWIMVLLAWFVTSVFVKEDIANSPLVQLFGYNNVCIMWDYEPATSVTAMFYPLVEIPLILYVVINFARTWEAWKIGAMGPWRFFVCALMFMPTLVFILWFRMIFVVKAFEDVKGHTLGFHGLMIALCFVALQNYLYHDSIGKLVGPKWASIGYLTVLWLVTAFKMIVAWSIFGGHPLWSVSTVSGQRAGHFLDVTWMVLGSVVPAILAYKNRSATPAMVLAYATAPKGVKEPY